MKATTIGPLAAAVAYRKADRIRSDHERSGRNSRNSPIGMAIGTRFGRIRIAAAVANPAITGARGLVPVTDATASIHSAAAGTSLIGCIN